ncbi:hypothetical protein C8R43DRAFT_438888 [Mycena crocata]|nr:hypothetical protein C8R43DRAFT_438888 [Mycena crocata]
MDDKLPGNYRDLPYALSPSANQLVRTNEPALESQIPELLNSIAVAQKAKSTLALEIIGAEMELDRLRRLDDNVTLHIQRCISAIGPIRRLPAEILSRIFILHRDACFYTFKGNNNEDDAHMFASGEVWRIPHVCAYWRSIALGTRELWSRFLLRCPGAEVQSRVQAGWQTWLQRAGSHSLDFSFICPGTHVDHLGRSVEEDYCHALLGVLLSRCQHWKDVRFRLPGSALASFAAIKGNIPLVETVHLERVIPRLSPPYAFNAFSVAPKLYKLYLSNLLSRTRADFPWHQITHYGGDFWDEKSQRHVLALAPNTSTFIMDIPHRPNGSAPISHQLRHLYFTAGETTLQRLVLPALQTIRFSMQHSHVPLVAKLLQRSGAAITQLHLDGWVKQGLDSQILAGMPELMGLAIVGGGGDDPHIPANHETDLTFDHIAAVSGRSFKLLPKLRVLSITGLQLTSPFLRMVESRRRALVECEPLKSLELPALSVLHSQSAQFLERLQRLEAEGLRLSFSVVVRPDPPAGRRIWRRRLLAQDLSE